MNLSSKSIELTEIQKTELIEILSKGARAKNRVRVKSMILYSFNRVRQYLNRFYLESGKVQYIAGQSYTNEIRDIRNLIINFRQGA